MAVDIGPGAIDRASFWVGTDTLIDLTNPANASGKLRVFQLWATVNMTGVKVGTFYGSGLSYTSRDVEVIGNVPSGSLQTFSGLDCDVISGDFAGMYSASGQPELALSGGVKLLSKAGDQFGTGAKTYSDNGAYILSIYGTGISVPTVTTSAATSISFTTATLNGNVTDTGGEDPTVTVYWGDNDGGTTPGNWDNSSAPTTPGQPQGVAAFTKAVTSLPMGTTIYFSAKATNAGGTTWGTTKSFVTLAPPTVTTQAVTSIGYASATGNGNITATGGEDPTIRGICWGASVNPTIAGPHAEESPGPFGVGAFTEAITGLAPVTHYYARAYATNTGGTAYGANVEFDSLVAPPTVTTQAVTAIDITTATGNGNITATSGADATVRGVCWGASANPTTAGSHSTESPGPFGTGAFTGAITGLTTNTHYHVRAYATNSAGTSYGADVEFDSLPTAPTVTTQAVTVIDITTATGNGNITDVGAPAPTIKGICWNTAGTPTTADPHTEESPGPFGVGAFSEAITGLITNTHYHVRAYGTNALGTTYGNEVTFTTLLDPTLAGGRWYKTRISMSDAADVTTPANRGYRARVPEVTTQAPSAVTTTTMTGNGNIINTAFTNVVQRGFCYLVGTSGDPIITDGEQYDEPGPYGTGAYTKALIGFAPGTNYRIRAFAVNGDGIGYGNTVQVLMKPAAPTNVAATDGTHTGKVGLTWTKSYGATDYHVWRDAVDLGAVGDVDAYDDMGGGPPTITPGVTQASDGTFSAYVEVAIVGEVANPGTTHTYKVVASNATGNSPDSATDTGYRGVGPLTYQIERTNLDDPGAPFSDLPGATTDPFDDTTAPAGP